MEGGAQRMQRLRGTHKVPLLLVVPRVVAMEWAALVRLTIGMILAMAAAAKWMRPAAVGAALRGYSLLPGSLTRPAALAVLIAESILAVALLGGIAPREALVGAAVLLSAFTVVLVWTLARRGPIGCGCLGEVLELRLRWPSVLMNLGLVAGAVAAATQPDLTSGPAGTHLILILSGILLAAVYWLSTYAMSVAGLVGSALRAKATQ
jgi:methylamine utilization protein MauE